MLKPQVKGVRLLKCTALKKKKKFRHILGLGDTGWDRLGLAARRPGFCRQAEGPGWTEGSPARASPVALGREWLCLATQIIAWARGCSETVNPPSKVLRSFPLALVDLCGLELIKEWESERIQPFPSGGATIAGQVPTGVRRGWW